MSMKNVKLFILLSILFGISLTSCGPNAGGVNPSEESDVTSETTSESESESEKPYTGPGWGGKQTSNAPSTYYSSCEGLSGTSLKNKLKSINTPKSPSYDWSRYEKIDEAEGDPDYVLSVYTRHKIKKDSHVGSYSWDTWNREHVYVQSKFSNSKTDNHNIFACEGQINNVRGNLKFGDVADTESNRVSVHGHKTDCYKANSLFEPCDEAKGEIARALMYGAMQYGFTPTQMITSVELLLEWHNNFPVTNREIYRNNTAYTLQGNRNPFIDHPEYGDLIWG